jgi:hypothetical protein
MDVPGLQTGSAEWGKTVPAALQGVVDGLQGGGSVRQPPPHHQTTL